MNKMRPISSVILHVAVIAIGLATSASATNYKWYGAVSGDWNDIGNWDATGIPALDVRDDAHVQKEKATDIWRGDSIQLAIQYPDSPAFLEIGAAQGADGQIHRPVWTVPTGLNIGSEDFDVACKDIPGGLRYELALPYGKFGLTDAIREKGFRFNLIVNDNDGTMREGFIRIAPGLGETKDAAAFPVLRLPTNK